MKRKTLFWVWALVLLGSPVWAGEKSAPARDVAVVAKAIDQEIDKALAKAKIPPSPLSDDAEFHRRAYLDLAGVVPSADKVVAFLENKDPGKRAKLIDELLASPRYGAHLADLWTRLVLSPEVTMRRNQGKNLNTWLAEQFNRNQPWDQLVTQMIVATGPEKDGPANFYTVDRMPSLDLVTSRVCQVFLGIQLQCTQCHDHPFNSWKRKDFWGMAAFFSKTSVFTSVAEGGKGKGLIRPDSTRVVPAKFLEGAEPKLDPVAPYRPVLAQWLTAPENPYFAKALVNRMWFKFFGRGLVHPVDDMRPDNPASHPELLKLLAAEFSAGGFDVKHLVRAICASQAYQRSGKPTEANQDDTQLFSHAIPRVMSPEQLYDALVLVLGITSKGQPNARQDFVEFFYRSFDANVGSTEYRGGIPEALRLLNSTDPKASVRPNTGAKWLSAEAKLGRPPQQLIERLFLTALSRRPSADEITRLTAYVKGHGEPARAYTNVLNALLNSSEFILNH